MKASAVSTITKSLPIEFSTLVNYSLLADLGFINLFLKKNKRISTAIGAKIKQSAPFKNLAVYDKSVKIKNSIIRNQFPSMP